MRHLGDGADGADGGSDDRGQMDTAVAAVIIGATLLIGFFVVATLFTSLPGTETAEENVTVTMDTSSATLVQPDAVALDQVDTYDDTDGEERVTNSTGTVLTVGSDYTYNNESDGNIYFTNTDLVNDGSDANIRFNYTHRSDNSYETRNRVGQGLLIGGVVIIVMFAGVILRVLRGL